jgi:hypothetical protein
MGQQFGRREDIAKNAYKEFPEKKERKSIFQQAALKDKNRYSHLLLLTCYSHRQFLHSLVTTQEFSSEQKMFLCQ